MATDALAPGGDQLAPKKLKMPFEKKDVFDSEDFDAIRFINQIYPDESSLVDLDKFMEALRKQVRAVDKEIFQAVRQASGPQNRTRHDLNMANERIAELFTKIRDIQRKAEESELVVQEICRDIKKLDFAKKHLTSAITALRRLAMLTAAITDLEEVAYRRDQYKKCADLLEAVSQLMEYFDQYDQVPKVKQLTRRLTTVQSALQEGVLDDFKLLMGTADNKLTPDNLERLGNACYVVNALGPKVRDLLMDWLCDREMGIYQTIFSMDGAKLDRFDRRFQWYKQRLDEKKEQWSIFPESWRVPQTLTLTFCKITKAHLKRSLNDCEEGLKEDVAPLIKCVVATNKFEKDMTALFGGATQQDEDDEDLAETSDNLSASEARKRLEAYRKRMQQQAAAKAAAKAGAQSKEGDASTATTFEGSVSEAFEDMLRYYVAEEEKELMSYLDTLMKEENDRRWIPASEDDDLQTRVLQSCNKLFFKIRTSLTRCVRLVSKGQTLAVLSTVFQKILRAYANELLKRLPKTSSGQTTPAPPFVGNEWQIKVSEEEEKVVCHILHTAEFCRDTMEGLTAAIQKDIKPAFADKVDLSEEENTFSSVSSQCLSVLVVGVNSRLDTALLEMQRVRWDTLEQPGDYSAFVDNARKVLYDCAPRLGKELDKTNLSFFCDKMVRMFVPRFVETIYKLRKVSEKGTLQLSIDADAVRRILLDFPRAAQPMESEPDMPNYMHYVEKEMGTVINVVKVLQSKPENLVDTFLLLMPASSSRDIATFQKLVELKSITKKQQTDLIAQFQKRLGQEEPMGASPLPAVSVAAATNLNAFKLNVNNFTAKLNTDLASAAAAATSSFKAPTVKLPQVEMKAPTRPAGHSPSNSISGAPSAATSANAAEMLAKTRAGFTGAGTTMKETAAKAREGLAKFGATFLTGNLGASNPDLTGAGR